VYPFLRKIQNNQQLYAGNGSKYFYFAMKKYLNTGSEKTKCLQSKKLRQIKYCTKTGNGVK